MSEVGTPQKKLRKIVVLEPTMLHSTMKNPPAVEIPSPNQNSSVCSRLADLTPEDIIKESGGAYRQKKNLNWLVDKLPTFGKKNTHTTMDQESVFYPAASPPANYNFK